MFPAGANVSRETLVCRFREKRRTTNNNQLTLQILIDKENIRLWE
jgi:hypothetical protein